MGGEMRDIRIIFSTRGVEHWPAEMVAACEASDSEGYGDWVSDSLRAAVREATERWAADHRDLLATEPDVI